MEVESAVRVALARLFATRHGRDVPLAELERAVASEGVPAVEVEPMLRELVARHIALRTPDGWRPAGPALVSRAGSAMATSSWLHS